jgi:prophage regulatory protein
MTVRYSLTKPSPRADRVLRPMPKAEPAPNSSTTQSHNIGDRLLRLPELVRTIGVSRATIYRYVDSGRLPSPVQLSTRCIAWRASEIAAWMAGLQGL